MEIEKLSNFEEPKDEGLSINSAIGSIREVINIIKQGKEVLGISKPVAQPVAQPQPQRVIRGPPPQMQPVAQPKPVQQVQPVQKTTNIKPNQNTEKIIGALDLVKTFKGDITISELQTFLTENQTILSKFF